jgi:hypothetical protein
MEACKLCAGAGAFERDGKLYECECALLRRIAAAMPSYVRRAEVLPAHLDTGLLEKASRSLYVSARWPDMKAVLKAVMIKYPSKFVRITSDAEIRDVYVGSRSRSARTADYEGDVYNNLADLMGPPDLCVVRLNEIANKNKAAPGALEEALSHRLDRDLPTWVLSNLDKRFTVGSFSYSEAVADLLSAGFEHVSVPQIHRTGSEDGQSLFSRDDFVQSQQVNGQAVSVKQDGKKEEGRPKRIRPSEDSDGGADSMLSRYGSGVKRGKSKFGRED